MYKYLGTNYEQTINRNYRKRKRRLCSALPRRIASQGETISEARQNLKEALELFFETASSSEVNSRLHEEVYVTHVEVAVG